MSLIWLDTETFGLNPEKHQIWEIELRAALRSATNGVGNLDTWCKGLIEDGDQ